MVLAKIGWWVRSTVCLYPYPESSLLRMYCSRWMWRFNFSLMIDDYILYYSVRYMTELCLAEEQPRLVGPRLFFFLLAAIGHWQHF